MGMSQSRNGLARSVRAQQPEHPGTGLQAHPGHRLGVAEPPGHIFDLPGRLAAIRPGPAAE
jgi:hypothetical protein